MAKITISKEDFEAAIPVASTKNSYILDMLQPYIELAAEEVERDIMGGVGMDAYEDGTNERLAKLAKGNVCFRAFLPHFRSLDVVLTATGFGVVSTQDTAPASKMRTDALKSQLDIEAERNRCALLIELFHIEGWNEQPIRQTLVPTLFWNFDLLGMYAGKESPIINDWRSAQPLIAEADGILRNHIGDALMDRLLNKLTSANIDKVEIKAVTMIQQIIGMHINGYKTAEKTYYKRLMNYIEKHIDSFLEYKDSDEYKYNHFKGYENTKDSGMFIFQG